MSANRRQFINASTLALAGAAVARVPLVGQAPPQAPAAPPVTKFEDLRRNVGIFSGQGGTIGWLATPDGALAVDSQFPATAAACVDGLKAKSPTGIDMLINTHSSRRSHRRKHHVPPGGEVDRAAGEVRAAPQRLHRQEQHRRAAGLRRHDLRRKLVAHAGR
jgi:hypothetical protein